MEIPSLRFKATRLFTQSANAMPEKSARTFSKGKGSQPLAGLEVPLWGLDEDTVKERQRAFGVAAPLFENAAEEKGKERYTKSLDRRFVRTLPTSRVEPVQTAPW